jgi:hypothetical protein
LDSTVGITSRYGLDDQGVGVRVPLRVKNFIFTVKSQEFYFYQVVLTGSGVQPTSYQMVLGTLSPGTKPAGREADH